MSFRLFIAKRRGALLAAASGLVFAASTPPLDLQPGILIGLVGFALSLRFGSAPPSHPSTGVRGRASLKPARSGAACGFWFGLAANVAALRFVPEVIGRFTPLPVPLGWVLLVLLSAAQALPWTAGGALASWLAHSGPSRKGLLPAFLAFAIGVYAASFVPAVFPWTPAGGLTRWPALLQTAELVGERGVSFLVASACALLATGIAATLPRADSFAERLRAGAKALAFGSALLLALVVYGGLRMRAIEAERTAAQHAKVALVQPDFDATFRWQSRHAEQMMDRLSALTKRAEESGAVLTVWPESAYPYTLAHGVKSSPSGTRAVLQQGVRGPVLTGAYLAKGGGLGTNSAILVEPNGDIGPSYDKRHLLWFGETVPFADTFPILRHVFARGTGLAAGTESVSFHAGPIVATILNCYEDTLPQAGREAMEARPNLLINITNDAWFAGSAEGELHLRLSVLRAIEARRDLVRAVNRGPTSWIGATGVVLARRDSTPNLGPSPPLIADAALLERPATLFTRAGDAPLSILLTATVLIAIVRARTRRRLG